MDSKANSSSNVNCTQTPCVNTPGQPIQRCLQVEIQIFIRLLNSAKNIFQMKKEKNNFLFKVSKAEVSSH